MGRSGRRALGPLGWRLFAAFTLVGVGAVALLAILAVASVSSQTTGLVASQRQQARRDIAAALAAAYAKGGSWQKADLAGAEALAQSTGARMIILDTSGGQVASITPSHHTDHESDHLPTPTGTGGDHGEHTGATPGSRHEGDSFALLPARVTAASPAQVSTQDRVAVVVNSHTVGAAVVDFPAVTDTPAWQARQAILWAVGGGTGLAIALAAAAALVVTRLTTRPLSALADAAGAVERGEPDATARLRPGPGELGQVSTAFARMASSVKREDELRRSLVADTAHELRTPVTILRGGTEELLDGLAQPTPGKLTSLHDEVLRLERLVDDLSDLAAAQSAALSMKRVPADLTEVATTAAGQLQAQFDDAGVKLDVVTGTAAVMVNGDPDRLTQIITNLLTNAVKYTPPGGRVTLTTATAPAGAQLTVADTGPGIPPGELPHIFERFWRGSAATTRAGTGIGLAVAAELAAAHGGTITAASPPGRGAAFTLDLPALP